MEGRDGGDGRDPVQRSLVLAVGLRRNRFAAATPPSSWPARRPRRSGGTGTAPAWRYRAGVAVPVLLIVAAVAAGCGLAYGTAAQWAGLSSHGMDVILWSRRLQWPLAAVALALGLWLVALIVSGRRRAWWGVGLVPVLALFTHRFVTGPGLAFAAADDPPVVPAAGAAGFLRDGDWVVGLSADGAACAYPYAVLFHRPVVVRPAPGGRRVVLLWSAYANRAVAAWAEWDTHGRDLEVVSFPADGVLVYNERLGQFLNGVTGRTPTGAVPTGFGRPIETVKTTWGRWRADHPRTVVVAPADDRWRTSPTGPVLPAYRVPGESGLPDARPVCVVTGSGPAAVASDRVTDRPLNLTAGAMPVLVVRGADGRVRAFDRSLPGDLVPRFAAGPGPSGGAAWVDADTGSSWSAAGAVVAGPADMRGVRLTPVPVDDGLYLGVMRYWYPDLHVVDGAEAAAGIAVPPPGSALPRDRRRGRGRQDR